MKVTIKLFAYLRQGRFKSSELEFPEGTTIMLVLEALSIKPDDLKIGILFVNGKHSTMETILKEGDVLAIFPPVAGG